MDDALPDLDPAMLDELAARALAEDLGPEGDITTSAIARPGQETTGRIISKGLGVLAGGPVAEAVFRRISREIAVDWHVHDGASVDPGAAVATVSGPAVALLSGERVALNFLQHLSGVATLTARFVADAARHGVTILCTRKTLPGLRAVQRYAVAVGGGTLHRAGLSEAVLIKTNHAILAGGVGEAVSRSHAAAPTREIEAEVRTLAEAVEAVGAGASRILVDNADHATIHDVVRRFKGKVFIEISGGIGPGEVGGIAALGPDAISVGRITHSVTALDLAMHLEGR